MLEDVGLNGITARHTLHHPARAHHAFFVTLLSLVFNGKTGASTTKATAY